jgi:membrane protease YdiL (CAAX protease family)
MIFQLPLINALAGWNKAIEFPDSLKYIETWMQNQELQAEKLTEVFLSMANLSDVFISLFIMAIIPAFGEELLFRGALQSILVRMTRNPHYAILITAFVFSFTDLFQGSCSEHFWVTYTIGEDRFGIRLLPISRTMHWRFYSLTGMIMSYFHLHLTILD